MFFCKILTKLQINEDKVYTVEDYKELPEGSFYQLIDGKLIGSPAPSSYHQRVLKKLCLNLYKAEKQGIGEILFSPIDVYLEEKEAYQPDIIFVSKDRLEIIREDGVYGPPDLVIEILSLFSAYFDLRHKKEVYEKKGVKEYWIVDPQEKSIEIYQNKENKFELIEHKRKEGSIKSPILDFLEIKLEDIF